MFCRSGTWLTGRPLPGQGHHAQVRRAHHRCCGTTSLWSCHRRAATLSGIWYETNTTHKLFRAILVGQACIAVVRFVQGLAFASVFTFIGTSAAHWGAVKEQLYFLTISFLALQVPGCFTYQCFKPLYLACAEAQLEHFKSARRAGPAVLGVPRSCDAFPAPSRRVVLLLPGYAAEASARERHRTEQDLRREIRCKFPRHSCSVPECF